jgi:hypothetical protein
MNTDIIIDVLNKYLLWDYLMLVVFSCELLKKIIGSFDSYKALMKPQQREIKKWLCLALATLIAYGYRRYFHHSIPQAEHAEWQIRLLINYFISTSLYELLLKYFFRSLKNRFGKTNA